MNQPGLTVPPSSLPPDVLRRLVEDVVTRQGADEWELTHSLEERVAAVMRQLDAGEAVITFDPASESVAITPRRR